MGCLKLTYYNQEEALEVNPLFLGKGLGRKVFSEKNRVSGYKYGFNGMEKDDDIKGTGNSYDFGARIYDPRIGKWLSLDPLAAKYPSYSPYHFSFNSPIKFMDFDGREIVIVGDAKYKTAVLKALLNLSKSEEGMRMITMMKNSRHSIVIGELSTKSNSNSYLGSETLETGNKAFYVNFSRIIPQSENEAISDSQGEPVITTGATSLAHEFRHVEQEMMEISSAWMYYDLNAPGVGGGESMDVPLNEVDATYFENLVRSELGLTIRGGYDGRIVYPMKPSNSLDEDDPNIWPLVEGNYSESNYFMGRMGNQSEGQAAGKTKTPFYLLGVGTKLNTGDNDETIIIN